MSESDRWVDVIREGVDCVLCCGALPDSDLAARQVTRLERITVAAPAYLDRFGAPRTPADLPRRRAVCLRPLTTGALIPFEFIEAGGLVRHEVASPFSVTGAESFHDAVLLGLGLGQMPLFHVAGDLAAGRLVRVMADRVLPSAPVSVLYPRSRQLSPRVRVFIDWAVRQFAERNRLPQV
jgi:DNA-binding transcriptional LysR family regulator